jgi:hypothetical protein
MTKGERISSAVAQQIVDRILLSTIAISNEEEEREEILAASIIDKREGSMIAAKSMPYFKGAFGVSYDGDEYGGSVALAMLSVVNEVKDMFGPPQAIITIHEDYKMMLIPLPAFDIFVGLVLARSRGDTDSDKTVSDIEKLVGTLLYRRRHQDPGDDKDYV